MRKYVLLVASAALLISVLCLAWEVISEDSQIINGHLALNTENPTVVGAIESYDKAAYALVGGESLLRVDLIESPGGNGHGDMNYLVGNDHTLKSCDKTYAAWGASAARTNKENGRRLVVIDRWGLRCTPTIGNRNYNWHQGGWWRADSGYHWSGARHYHPG